jgi:hypothetical protein
VIEPAMACQDRPANPLIDAEASPNELPKQSLYVQSRYHHGIDFKNPFTMSNMTGIARPSPCLRTANRFSSSIWMVVERV